MRWLVRLTMCACLLPAALAAATQAPAQTTHRTIVSLTFDDGTSSQYAVGRQLSRHHMRGTFYINSAMVGSSPYYLNWPQIRELSAAGNEIGGHTLHHKDLTSVSPARATREVCGDRRSIHLHGLPRAASFAYPNAKTNATVERIVRSCGYRSGRNVGNINSITACTQCPYAETIPGRDRYNLRTPRGITSRTSLANLKTYVTNAETHAGGWVILQFHGICDNRCTKAHSMHTATFRKFLNWLQARSAQGTVVRTVGNVASQ